MTAPEMVYNTLMFDITSDILTKSGLTAEQLQQAESAVSPGNGYNAGFYQALVDAEKSTVLTLYLH